HRDRRRRRADARRARGGAAVARDCRRHTVADPARHASSRDATGERSGCRTLRREHTAVARDRAAHRAARGWKTDPLAGRDSRAHSADGVVIMRQRITVLCAAIAVLAVTFEAVVWMAANPLPSYWDEAGYYASTVHNTRLVRHFGLSRFGVAWNFDPFRPPINVILPLPVALIAQNSLLAMRLFSWAGFLAAALLAGATLR